MLEVLKKLPLLYQVDEELLKVCLGKYLIEKKSYKRGVTIYEQGKVCETLDVVVTGELHAYSLGDNGSAITIFEFAKGSMIGANLLFGSHHEYPFNIYCLADCEVIHIHKKGVEKLLRDYSFVMTYIRSLSMNSQGMNRKIKMLTERTLRENIMEYLDQQSKIQNTKSVILPMSKKALADYLGVQRPSLFRELKKLKEEGIIKVSNKIIELL